jgi:acetyl-CoA C-acetyltransferase
MTDPEKDPVVIAGAARTPMGGLLGDLKEVPAPKLGAEAIGAAVRRAGADAALVDEVLMGCVLSAGLGQPPRAAGRSRRRPALLYSLHDGEQDVRLGHVCRDGRP